MANKRDASRIRIKFPDADYDADGSVDVGSAFYACLFEGPNWSGMTKNSRNETCTGEDATFDDFDNLIEQVVSGKVVNLGTIDFTVDWDPDEDATGGKVYAAFRMPDQLALSVEFPTKDATESAGPKLVITVDINGFVPVTNVLSEDDEARSAARLSGTVNGLSVVQATAV